MSDAAIRVENLSKLYRISHLAKQKTIRDAVHQGMRLVWRRLRWKTRLNREEFWALRDVSFEVGTGEIVGIVGRNGAGKSTLLKVLSRITEPTSGRMTLRGRVSSLLEVGTGFHPDLSGRDNIFLNGAIHGLKRTEILKKFDQIVEFAEVAKFLDTPVKRYSSGMYVRLAFAVAAHLEPDILIVDEVLAVGDAAFQQKCLGKMRDVTRGEGRTILLVSHNMAAIQVLCQRAIFLNGGRIGEIGSVSDCIKAYLSQDQAGQAARIELSASSDSRQGDGFARIENLEILGADGAPRNKFAFNEPFELKLGVRAHRPLRDYVLGFSINAVDDMIIACSNHHDSLPRVGMETGLHEFSVRVADMFLSPGYYTITVAISDDGQHGLHDLVRNCAKFSVESYHSEGRVDHPHILDDRPGLIRRPLVWTKDPAKK